jgi:hypothetical protein
VFAAGFSDGSVALYSTRHSAPLAHWTFSLAADLRPGSPVVLLQWLRRRPGVLVALDASGTCAVFDLSVSTSSPVFVADMAAAAESADVASVHAGAGKAAGLPRERPVVLSASCTGGGPLEPAADCASVLAVLGPESSAGDAGLAGTLVALTLNAAFCVPREGEREEFVAIIGGLR